MKLLLLFLLFSTPLFAAKTFTFEATVNSMATMQPLKGIIVRCILKEGEAITTSEKITNENGKVFFTDLTEKDYTFLAIDPTGEHRETEISYYNPKREDETGKVYLCFNSEKEAELIAEKTKSIPYDSSDFAKCSTENWTDPQFSGGMKGIQISFMYNLRYPQSAIEESFMGKVYLSFVIEPDGSLTNVKVVRGIQKELDTEAIRIVCYLVNWEPAKCNGDAVRAQMYLPVNFSLE